MTSWTINSETSLQTFIGDMRELFRVHKFVKVSAKVGKARSIDQNGVSHVWYAQIARELREDDEVGWKGYCKLHHAVPIMRAEDPEFRQFYDLAIKGLSYEQKLSAMKFMPVTSLMTKLQLNAYLEAMQNDFLERGVKLEFLEQ
jgi:hypothetical protein